MDDIMKLFITQSCLDFGYLTFRGHPFFSFFSLSLTSSTYCRCRGLLLQLITFNETHTHSLGILWRTDQPIAKASIWQHTTFTTDNHDPDGIRTRNPSKRAAAELRLKTARPPGPAVTNFSI